MIASRFVRTFALSALTLVSMSAAAFAAQEAYTKSNSNLRVGPGTRYSVIDTLPAYSPVSVDACSLSWCAVTTEDDQEGFIAKSLLRGNRVGPEAPFSIGITIGPKHPFGRFGSFSGGFAEDDDQVPYPPRHVRNDDDEDEVCFYQQENFKGANFCVKPGQSDDDIPGSFNDSIESVLISGDAIVELCAKTDFRRCRTFDASVGRLPSSLYDNVSSYSVDSTGGSGFHNSDDDDSEDDDQSQWSTPDTNGGNFGTITLDN